MSLQNNSHTHIHTHNLRVWSLESAHCNVPSDLHIHAIAMHVIVHTPHKINKCKAPFLKEIANILSIYLNTYRITFSKFQQTECRLFLYIHWSIDCFLPNSRSKQ